MDELDKGKEKLMLASKKKEKSSPKNGEEKDKREEIERRGRNLNLEKPYHLTKFQQNWF